jgi:hypothetical protein
MNAVPSKLPPPHRSANGKPGRRSSGLVQNSENRELAAGHPTIPWSASANRSMSRRVE